MALLQSLNMLEQRKSKILQNEVVNLMFENQSQGIFAQDEGKQFNLTSSALRALDLPMEFPVEFDTTCEHKVYLLNQQIE